MVVSELKGRAAEAYPINRLRNLAILKVVTSHLLLTDIDLWPSSTAYAATRTPNPDPNPDPNPNHTNPNLNRNHAHPNHAHPTPNP